MLYRLKADIHDEGRPLKHFWSNCVAAGRAHEGLRANWQQQLRMAVKECGFRYIRFHGLFHDEMFVYRKQGNRENFNWQYVDELFDMLLETGIKPFVELSFFPKDIAADEKKVFWWGAHVTPPNDFSRWESLIRNAVRNWIERYGIDEVRKWYFEFWNEPCLNDFWNGTRSQYFKLYNITSRAIKAIDAKLRIGGPATCGFVPDERFTGETEDDSKRAVVTEETVDTFSYRPVWVREFLEYCGNEGLAVDFVSTHPYPTEWAFDGHGSYRGITRSVNATRDDLQLLRDIVSKSQYPDAEIHLTEWSSTPTSRDVCHDCLPMAAFIVKANLDSTGLADSLAFWTFTDVVEECGAGDSVFHGGFGLINFQGIVKPGFHAYRLLNRLGDVELGRNECCIVTKNSGDDSLRILAYNFPGEVKSSLVLSEYPDRKTASDLQAKGSPRTFEIEITGLPPRKTFTLEMLDKDHGSAMDIWVEMGMPEPPTRGQLSILKAHAMSLAKFGLDADQYGVLRIRIELMPWSVALIC